MRRIHEKRPVEETIWDPVSVPMARFTAFEQIAKSVKRRRLIRATLGRKSLRTSSGELR